MNVAGSIFEMQLTLMKRILKLGEFKFGKESDQFKFFKEEVMNATYEGTKKFFNQMSIEGIFEKCSCGANIRHGWKECQSCSGSGFKDIIPNKKE